MAKRIQTLRLENFSEYLDLLHDGPIGAPERVELFNAITINETYFFRHEPQMAAMETTLIPSLARLGERGSGRRIRVWCAACSTGEEPYSIAMMFLHRIKPRCPGVDLEIVGTDLNTSVLSKARRGIYSAYALRNTSDAYRQAFFACHDGTYELSSTVRDMVRFEQLNLVDRHRMSFMRSFDIVLCCNVLIYFDTASKIQVVSDLYRSLNHGGHLIVGTSESLNRDSSALHHMYLPKTVYNKNE